jgi:Acetyltransferase (GNAT) domain
MLTRQLVNHGESPEQRMLLASLSPELRDGHPLYGAFGRSYYPAVYGSRLVDQSFVLSAPQRGCILVECDVLDGTLGRFGMPIRMIVSAAEAGTRRRLIREAVTTLAQVAFQTGVDEAIVADPDSHELLSDLGLACLAAGGRMGVRMHAVADLSLSEKELLADVRKSAKSLLNWGRRALALRYCNVASSDREAFDAYRRLHREVAGKVTRSEHSWEVMFDTVRTGRGELTLATLDADLVGGTLVVDGIHSSYYASGAYRRSHFDRPLGHWPLMDAILRAKARGMRWFEVGEILVPGDGTNKERAIGFFKKAFTSRVSVHSHWLLPGVPESPSTGRGHP